MSNAVEGKQMMLAEAGELNISDQHYLIMVAFKSLLQWLQWILLQSSRNRSPVLSYPGRGILHPIAIKFHSPQ